MNPLTQFKRIRILPLLVLAFVIGRAPAGHAADLSATPVIDWSTEARRAIVPPSAGPENYGKQISRRGGRIHGNRPCRNLRCGSRY